MRAMVLEREGEPLRLAELPAPKPGAGELLVEVEACGVCRTDVHIVDGELTEPKLPLVLGHQVVGRVAGVGEGVEGGRRGERVGIPWLGWVCGECRQCRAGRENLCERAELTGYTRDGGFAELAVADGRFCFGLDPDAPAAGLAPLLCAGLIGYRALRMCGEAERLGLYGFGSSAHIVCQLAAARGWRVHAFTRPGDEAGQRFARSLGASWAGASDEMPPEPLEAAIVFAPVGALVPLALRAVGPGGRVVCAGIHMSDIPSFPYADLWRERSIRSVANLTREDGRGLLAEAARAGVETQVRTYPLEAAGEAIDAIRSGALEGSAVLVL